MVKPSDLDGLKVVINMILQGQLTCIADILKALAEKAPGLVDALKLIIQLLMIIGKKLVEIAKNIYDKLDDSIKQMLKNVTISLNLMNYGILFPYSVDQYHH
jgi:hypothetical protein